MNATRSAADRGQQPFRVLGDERLLPVAVLDASVLGAADSALRLGAAVRAGGLSSIEITLRTAAAIPGITALARDGELVVGAGTVITKEHARIAIDAGAGFIVCPGVSASVIDYCREMKVPVIPGVATATEIQAALGLGCDVLKFFPADINGGLPAIAALAAPFAGVRFIPTGGIDAANVGSYIAHPAVLAVGGSWMVARPLIAASEWNAITDVVCSAVAIVDASRAVEVRSDG
jgi:2-dehydro-3-deoxyphosphogluconate aldolase/(4S)-4-hydroxy-2-oxoglutarate aldolase